MFMLFDEKYTVVEKWGEYRKLGEALAKPVHSDSSWYSSVL